DGRARHLVEACEASLRALSVSMIDLYQLHAPDPRTPFATSVRALAAVQRAGLARSIGLCNVSVPQIEQARGIVEIASVQVRLHAFDAESLESGVVEYCARNGIRLIAHTPLGGPKGARALRRDPAMGAAAKRHGAT